MPEGIPEHYEQLVLPFTSGPPEPLLTTIQIAQMLAVHRSWVDMRVREGTIPFVRVGRYPRFRWSEVSRWIASGGARCLRGLPAFCSELEHLNKIAPVGAFPTETGSDVDSSDLAAINVAQVRGFAPEGDPS